MEKLRVGKIVGTHALKGELKIRSTSDFNEERFVKGYTLYIRYQQDDIEMKIASVRVHKTNYLIAFEGCFDINLVEKYIGCYVYALKNEELLDNGEYYVEDIIGCHVYDGTKEIGDVIEVIDNGRHDVLVIDCKGKKVRVPYVEAFVKEEDIKNKKMVVTLIKGMLDED